MKQKNGTQNNSEDLITDLVYTSPSLVISKPPSEVDRERQITRYSAWLQHHDNDTRQRTQQIQQANESYQKAALQEVTIGKRNIRTFAPFKRQFSALETLSRKQLVFFFFCLLLLTTSIIVSYMNTLVVVMAAITILYLGSLLLQFVMSLRTLFTDFEEHIDETVIAGLTNVEWPAYTIICPLYKETAVIPQFIQALYKLDYPREKLQILLLTEEDDTTTNEALYAAQLPAYFTIVVVPSGTPRTKPRACNYGLLHASGEYVVIYDAEDVMDPLQLKRAVLVFANHDAELVCVQAKLNFYNSNQNILTRWFTAEYSSWFDLLLPGLQYLGFPLPLGGTSNHLRTDVLRALGGWDAFNVTEDCELGMRLSQYKFKTIMVNSTTFEEATSQVNNWLRQRSRWIKGYLQTYLVHMRHPQKMLQQGKLREFIALQFLIGGRTLALFINPILWAVLAIYFLFRPYVANFYLQIFPTPVLYMGTLCLIFGNFFYVYTHLFGCVRRHQFYLVKWALLIPLYWAMMSAAAIQALWQLMVKPHYWEKTMHGLHLKHDTTFTNVQEEKAGSRSTSASIATIINPHINTSTEILVEPPASELEEYQHPIPTRIAQAFSMTEQKALRRPAILTRDLSLLLMFFFSTITSILSSVYFYANNETLIYNDAYSHLRIARSVIDSATPGFAQLGGVWLPFHHLLMLPFIWNDLLWRTGIAGSIPSMCAYVIACLYLFLSIRIFTRKNSSSFIGTLIFLLNPNILYLQSTALSELLCIGTVLMAGYYFLRWAQEDQPKFLILSAFSVFIVSLIRYDGWAFFLVLLFAIALIGFLKKHKWRRIEGNLLLFFSLAGFGIGLWLLWCQLIFGDALYFQHGPYSAQAQQNNFLQRHTLYAYHNIWQSIRYYGLDTLETVGGMFFVLACISIVFFLIRYRFTPMAVASMTVLTPFLFYTCSLYLGQAIIYLPDALPGSTSVWLNVRYGAEMVAPLAFFLAIGFASIPIKRWFRAAQSGLYLAFIILVLGQALIISDGNNLALNDGLYNRSCASTSRPIHIYLAQHYNGQNILSEEYTSQLATQVFGAQQKALIYEGSGDLWKKALAQPENMVDWIVMRPGDPKDIVAQALAKHQSLLTDNYTRVVQEKDGMSLYQRNHIASLPGRPIPAIIIANKLLCEQYSNFSL